MPEDRADVPYEVGDSPELAEALVGSFDQAITDELMIMTGACPRCGHTFRAELPLRKALVTPGRTLTGMSSSGLTDGPVEHLVPCSCMGEHAGRPDDEVGCGAMAKIVCQLRTQ